MLEFTSTVRTSISSVDGIVVFPEFLISQNLMMCMMIEEIVLSGKSKATRTPIALPSKIANYS